MIVDQEYWNKSYENYVFQRLPIDDPTKIIIERYIPTISEEKNAFELGCFPGRYLVEIGQKGYTLNGCDQTNRVKTDLPIWLQKNQCKVGVFEKSDYKEFYAMQYDLVASFGFIEHFNDYENVFNQQCHMVKSGGILIIQYPNFRGLVQRILHGIFDIDNLNNHVVISMDLNFYSKHLSQDFKIIYCSYYGNFDFWIDDFKNKNGLIKRKFLKYFHKTKRIWSQFPDSRHWSPYAIIIAEKK